MYKVTAENALDHTVTLCGVLDEQVSKVDERGALFFGAGDLVNEGIGVLDDLVGSRVNFVALDDRFAGRQKVNEKAHGVGTLKISC